MRLGCRFVLGFLFLAGYLRLILAHITCYSGSPTPLHALYQLDYLQLAGEAWSSLTPLLFGLFEELPDATQYPWSDNILFVLFTYLVKWLVEGAWWTFFRWLCTSFAALTLLLTSHKRHQRFRRDVRFCMHLSLEVSLTGFNTTLFRTTWHRHHSLPHHHQFALHVRLRAHIKWKREPRYRLADVPQNKRVRLPRGARSRVAADLATRQSSLLERDLDYESIRRLWAHMGVDLPVDLPTPMDYYKACTDGRHP